MAFCKQCGTDLSGARFCPTCGAAADTDMAATQGQTVAPVGGDLRSKSLMEMDNMLKHFGLKKAQYDQYEEVTAEVEKRQAAGFGWCIALCVISAVVALFCDTALQIILFLAAIGFIVLRVFLKKQNKQKLEEALVRQAKIATDLQNHYEAYGYCPVGFEYTKPSVLAEINNVIRKGRASNFGDAINLMMSDRHMQKMEEQAEATRKATEETAKQTKKAAKSAKRAANYSAADFWLK